MQNGSNKTTRIALSERLLSGWEEIYRGASPPLMALRLVESEIEVLRSLRTQDPEVISGLLDRYEKVAERLSGASTERAAETRLNVLERALGRWERMFDDGSFRRLNARLMEREAAMLSRIRDHDPARVDALVRRYLVLAAELRSPHHKYSSPRGRTRSQ